MMRLVNSGEFESPQEAAWLLCADELSVDQARQLADHWLSALEATDALIGFEVECMSATKPLAWWWLKPKFEQALISLGAQLLDRGDSLGKIAARQTKRYVTGGMPREEFVGFLETFWKHDDFDFPESFSEFSKATRFDELWRMTTAYDYYPPTEYPPGFKDNIDALLDEAANDTFHRIKSIDSTS